MGTTEGARQILVGLKEADLAGACLRVAHHVGGGLAQHQRQHALVGRVGVRADDLGITATASAADSGRDSADSPSKRQRAMPVSLNCSTSAASPRSS